MPDDQVLQRLKDAHDAAEAVYLAYKAADDAYIAAETAYRAAEPEAKAKAKAAAYLDAYFDARLAYFAAKAHLGAYLAGTLSQRRLGKILGVSATTTQATAAIEQAGPR